MHQIVFSFIFTFTFSREQRYVKLNIQAREKKGAPDKSLLLLASLARMGFCYLQRFLHKEVAKYGSFINKS